MAFDPPHISPRIPAQAARFTTHPAVETKDGYDWLGTLRKITIPRDAREFVRKELVKLNLTRGVLFPGLDGAAEQINRRFTA